MSDYGFILEDMNFSYSSASTFHTCAYNFYLTYIEMEPREGNWFSDYGSHIHEVLEKYFRNELESYQLSDYYSENYDKNVTHNPPPYPNGMAQKYREQGQLFFDYFSFDKSLYDILIIEDMIKTEFKGIKLVVKPDLILKEKSTGKNILFDYKSSTPFLASGKRDKKKFEGYIKQLYLYKYFINKVQGIQIDKIILWFPRLDRMEEIEINEKEELKTIEWFTNTVKDILKEEEFKADTSNKYFCENLCSMFSKCRFANKTLTTWI